MGNTPNVTGHTHMLCMIGSPVDHSMSPATHTRALAKQGIDAVFLVFDVDAEDVPDVMRAFRRMGGWDGGNVTMPCKQAVIPCLDEISPAAELMGAVNAFRKEPDGRITGHNTDGEGFMNNLINNGVEVKGATMTLVGPGGAGSAILVQAALDGVARLNVFAREGGTSYRHAQSIAGRVSEKTGCDVRIYPLENTEELRARLAESTILANGTNVGMGEGSTDSPVPAEVLHAGLAVADVIYTPAQTQLLRDAAACGARTFNGLGMLNEQAVVAERVWYGLDAREAIEQTAAELAALEE